MLVLEPPKVQESDENPAFLQPSRQILKLVFYYKKIIIYITMVSYVKNDEEWESLMEKSKMKLVVVDFTATWCPPCQRIAPKFEAMARDFSNLAIFVKVDVDDADTQKIAHKCGIQAMPTFQFYKNGVKVDELQGADEESLRNKVEKNT